MYFPVLFMNSIQKKEKGGKVVLFVFIALFILAGISSITFLILTILKKNKAWIGLVVSVLVSVGSFFALIVYAIIAIASASSSTETVSITNDEVTEENEEENAMDKAREERNLKEKEEKEEQERKEEEKQAEKEKKEQEEKEKAEKEKKEQEEKEKAEKKEKEEKKKVKKEKKDEIPAEYTSALNKAESYSEMMYMSKKGLYDQLTSEYGESFSEEAAQYAVDNIKAD